MFRKILIPFSFFSLISISFAVQTPIVNSEFNKANELYRKNNFEVAAKEYKKLVDSGYESSALYYNLGNAYYRQGALGNAILFYEKALKLNPNDEDAAHNLALANSKTVDRIEPLPKFFIFQWWESLLAIFNINGWTISAYIFFILILISIAIYFFSKQNRAQKYSFWGGLIMLTLFIFSTAILTVRFSREENIKNAIITETIVNIKTAPDNDSNDAFVVHEGLKVKLEDKINNWVKVRLQDGKVGWTTNNKLKVI